MKKYCTIFIILLLFISCRQSGSTNSIIEIQTKAGDIQVELYPGKAPKSVAAFLENIDKEVYKNSSFYRVLTQDNQQSNATKAELIQGGLFKTNYTLSTTLPRIPHENTQQTGILHTDGVISFARQAPGTAGTEFFICIGEQPGFDYGSTNNPDGQGYAAFGKVVKGMEVVKKIHKRPESDEAFDPPVAIYNLVRL